MAGTTINGTVNNGITITGTAGAYASPLTISNGGYVINHGTGKAVFGGSATVVNDGRIVATGNYGGYGYQGIYLDSGSVDNTGTITASGNAIVFEGAGTITNSGTVRGGRWGATARDFTTIINSGTLYGANHGVVLSGGGYVNNSKLITGEDGLEIGGASGTVVNSGSIISTYGLDVVLSDGGGISNSSTGVISVGGAYSAVNIYGAAGTVVNAGTIEGTDTGGTGIYLEDGGTVANTGTARIIGYNYGVRVAGDVGTVTNTGRIGAAGSYNNDEYGVRLHAGGSIINGSTGATAALIYSSYLGVDVSGAAGTVTNYGTVTGTDIAIRLQSGGTIINGPSGATGALISAFKAVAVYGIAGTVINAGTITGAGYGVRLTEGGSVANNGTASLITGVDISGAAGTVTNAGTITHLDIGPPAGQDAVYFSGAYNDTLTNSGTIFGQPNYNAVSFSGGDDRLIVDPGAVFTGVIDGGSGANTIELASAASTGTITGLGISFVSFGTITVDAGADWHLTGGNTIASGHTLTDSGTVIAYGTLTNAGTLTGSGHLIVDPGTLINSGSVGIAVTLDSGSYLDNTSTGTITVASGDAVYGTGGAVRVVNPGTITAPNGRAVYLNDGGTVSNTGTGALISGSSEGIEVSFAYGTVTNAGTITGTSATGTGVYLTDGGSIANTGTAALVSGGEYGIRVGFAAGTVTNTGKITGTSGDGVYFQGTFNNELTNTGTISGGTGQDAVKFGGGSDLLVVDPGAVFIGDVDGAGGYNTLELGSAASTGTISGLGTSFVNFGTITVDAGAAWNLTGSNTIASGVTLNDDGVLTNSGTLIGSGYLIVDPGTMVNTGSVGIAIALDAGSYLDNTSTGTITVAGTAVVGAGVAVTVVNSGVIYGTGGGTASGIYLGQGGTVTNEAGGLIGAGYAVVSTYVAGTLVNDGTVSGTVEGAHFGAGGVVVNEADGLIEAATGVAFTNIAGTVLNAGTISGAVGYAVMMAAGGSVTNGATNNTTAMIAGYRGGIRIQYTTGTVTNYGTIEATATADGSGVYFYTVGAVANYGTIQGSGARYGAGVYMGYGGTVTNGGSGATSALVEGYYGVEIKGTTGVVLNLGTIESTATFAGYGYGHGGNDGYGVLLNRGGTITNGSLTDTTAVISSPDGAGGGVSFGDRTGVLVNYGTVFGGYYGAASFNRGGVLLNQASGSIEGYLGAYFGGGTSAIAGTVQNYGTINGIYGPAVIMGAGGTVSNGSTVGSTATIQGALGVVIGGDIGTVMNFGTIAGVARYTGYGVYLRNGGIVTNEAGAQIKGGVLFGPGQGTPANYGTLASYGTLLNYGTITTPNRQLTGVGMVGGTIVNGASGASAAVISGSSFGVFDKYAAATITNFGTITTQGTGIGGGIVLTAGGTIINAVGGLIRGGTYAIEASYATVVNGGMILSTGTYDTAVAMLGGGLVINGSTDHTSATIQGNGAAVAISGATGTIANFGTIAAVGPVGAYHTPAVYLYGGSVTNGISADTAASITSAYGDAIVVASLTSGGAGTITNFGTISAAYSGASTYGIKLFQGGEVINGSTADTTALIAANYVAVYGQGAPLTVTNYGTIENASATAGKGIVAVAGGVVANAVTGTIAGYQGISFQVEAGTVINAGSIASSGAFSSGVDLGAGGTLTNTGTISATGTEAPAVSFAGAVVYNGPGGATGALITGVYEGVVDSGAAGSLFNYGTIQETGTGGLGAVEFVAGGTVDNFGLIQSTGAGVSGVDMLGVGTVINTGTILASGTSSIGVDLGSGGTVDNGNSGSSAGLISGDRFGVFGNGATDLSNYGTIKTTGTIAVYLAAGGTVANHGSISGPGGVYVVGGSGSNSVTNAAGGRITATKIAVDLRGTIGTFFNYGAVTDTGSTNAAVYLGAGGHVVNGSTSNTTATIISTARTSVAVKNTPATITNFGTISSAASGTAGAGVYLAAGGEVLNEASGVITAYRPAISTALVAATLVNYGTVESTGSEGPAVYLAAGGRVVNQGLIESTNNTAVLVEGGVGSIDNFGTIFVNGTGGSGVYVNHGGTITNEAGATISAYRNAISIGVTAAAVVNYGSVSTTGPHAAVYSNAGGLVVNGSTANTTADITAAKGAVTFQHAAGTVVNYGTLGATGTGGAAIYVGAGGTITNKAGALLTGLTEAVGLGGTIGATLANFGTVVNTGTGVGPSVQIMSAGTVLNHGAIESGIFVGGTATTTGTVDIVNSTLITGTTGVGISSFAVGPNSIVNYGTIIGASGIAVQLGGNDSTLVIEPNSVLNGAVGNFHAGDVIDFAHKVANGFTFASQVLTLTNDGTVLGTVGLAGVFSTGSFVLRSDGAGGTDVKLAESVFSGVYPFGVTLSVPGIEDPATFTSTAYVTNGATGNANSALYGTNAASWIVYNAGTTAGGGSAGANGILLVAGGTVSNTGIVLGNGAGGAAIALSGGQGSVVNSGRVDGPSSGTIGAGIYLSGGGTVTNEAGGTIAGYSYAARFTTYAGTVVNYGSIGNTSTATAAVAFGAGGSVVNGSSLNRTATISSTRSGISVAGGAGTVTNFATIVSTALTHGSAVYTTGGGTVTNEAGALIEGSHTGVAEIDIAGTIINAGLIESLGTGTASYGVYLAAGGAVVNGSTANTTAQILGGYAAIETIDAPATIVNYGTIATSSAGAGVYLKGGGLVTNGPDGDVTATIESTAGAGIAISGAPGTVANYGTILTEGTYSGVGIYSSGSLVNIRLIEGGGGTAAAGVYIGNTVATTGTVAVTNSGTIVGSIGVEIGSLVAGPTTIINYGAIQGSGGTAIQLGGTADTVVLEPGYSLTGAIAGFMVGDEIDFAHEFGTAVSYSGGTLELLNGSSVVGQVALAGAFANGDFTLRSDGSGGSDIGLRTGPVQPNELTRAGLSDALMTESGGGVVLDEVLNGAMTYTQVGGIGPEWEFEGAGPLLGDGNNQFLLYYGTNDSPAFGAVVAGEVVGGAAQYTQIGGIGPEWQFEGVGPLAGGSSADFLIWNGSSSSPGFGALFVGSVVGGSAQYTEIGSLGPEWQFEGVRGFLNNGSTDFLLWDTNSSSSSYGAVVAGQDVGGTAQYTVVGGLDPTAWQFEGSGDLLSDGKDSFLIRNVSNGGLLVGEVNGGTAHYTAVGGVGPEWQFLGVGNYDGKSPAEFLMESTSGSTPGTLVVGTIAGGATTYQQVGAVGPAQWTFRPTNPALLG